MMKEHERAIEQVGQAFENLGSSREQAQVMAQQLVKRAQQLQNQNNSTFLEELAKLLQTVSCGAQGELKPEDEANFS
jgi:prefoldin subunit 5